MTPNALNMHIFLTLGVLGWWATKLFNPDPACSTQENKWVESVLGRYPAIDQHPILVIPTNTSHLFHLKNDIDFLV
jgi:hypothetical protein